jgi:uncharacterized Zn finger protein
VGDQRLDTFAERDLRRLAGPSRFARGQILIDGVTDLYEDEFSVCATVFDGRPYLAMVHHSVGLLGSECDCPAGGQGLFCEHSVAVGLCYGADGDGH